MSQPQLDPAALQRRVQELEQALHDVHIRNKHLASEVEALRHTRDGEKLGPAPSVDASLDYLSKCPQHEGLSIPIINPAQYIEWCEEKGVAANLMLGRRIPSPCTPSDLRDLLQGEPIAEDGPFQGGRLQAFSKRQVDALGLTEEEACRGRRHTFSFNPSMNLHYNGLLAAWRQGNFRPIMLRSITYGLPYAPTTFFISYNMLVVCKMDPDPQAAAGPIPEEGRNRIKAECADGEPRLCLLMHAEPDLDVLDPRIWPASMTEHMALKHAPAMMVTCSEKGYLLYQNAASIGRIGVMGQDLQLPLAQRVALPYSMGPYQDVNYLQELWGSKTALATALDVVAKHGQFRQRLAIKSPILLSLMQLPPYTKVYHDVSISRLRDGVTGSWIYLVAEVDVTSAVRAEQRVQRLQAQQRALLKNILPQQVIDVLLEEKQAIYRPTLPSLPGNDPMTGPSGNGNSSPLAQHTPGSDDRPTPTPLRPGARPFTTTNGAVQLSTHDVQRLSTFHESVSILFADIVGFTAMSQQVHPAQVMLFLNQLFARFDELSEECDVYKVKTIGDCYMVCAGLFDRTVQRRSHVGEKVRRSSDRSSDGSRSLLQSLSVDFEDQLNEQLPQKDVLGGKDPQHAEKILRFAKALLTTVKTFQTPSGAPVQLRVGIHTGSVMSGVVGRKMPRFSCFGDTVNTASRMETLGTPNCIHATAAFRSMTSEEPWVYSGGVEVKGKGWMDTFLLEYTPEWEDVVDRYS